jgi:tRNA A-37 threonylcarbamoyl transferase component Bud32
MAASPSPSTDEQLAIGSVVDDRYRIDGILGTGGMGRVYRAEHTKIGKAVAIKVLHADLHRNREASQRFQREAIASGRLDHPNIVGVSDFGVLDDGACYLVMEVLEGESLGDRLERDGRIPWLEAIDILRGVLAGLRHAHDRGVVHRDIKPDNVFLAHKDGEAVIKILDFGIAKLYAGSADDPASTRAGLTVGTPAYLSPEQAVGGEITPASDLYSASVVLYEMLAGQAPFEDKDPLAMLGAHVGRPPPAFAVIAPGVDIPPPLEDIIRHGLAKAPAERIASATDYLAMLDAVAPPSRPRLATSPVIGLTQAEALGMAATGTALAAWPATATPYAGSPIVASTTTPYAGSPAVPVAVASTATPFAGSPVVGGGRALSTEKMPRATRMVSLADVPEPIPKTWIVRSGVLAGLAVLVALVLVFVKHCGGGAAPTPGGAAAVTPADARPAPAPVVKPIPAPANAPEANPPGPSGNDASAPAADPSTGSGSAAAAAPPHTPPPPARPSRPRPGSRWPHR